jgi:hypothetical protein
MTLEDVIQSLREKYPHSECLKRMEFFVKPDNNSVYRAYLHFSVTGEVNVHETEINEDVILRRTIRSLEQLEDLIIQEYDVLKKKGGCQ